jgi:hypothetical protein
MNRLLAILLVLLCVGATVPTKPPRVPGAKPRKPVLQSPKGAEQAARPLLVVVPKRSFNVTVEYVLAPTALTNLVTGIEASTNLVHWTEVWRGPYKAGIVSVSLTNRPWASENYRAFWTWKRTE